MYLNVGRPSVRLPFCGPMYVYTQARDLLSATGSFVERDSHAVMNCNGMPEHIQVCQVISLLLPSAASQL